MSSTLQPTIQTLSSIPSQDPPIDLASIRVALVHDFFYVYGGAERVVEQIIDVFPGCDLFALFDFVPDDQRAFLHGKSVKTSFLQKLPLMRRCHRNFLPLMPLAIEQLDVSGYDLVISSSYAVAKGVLTGPNQTHICYCHSPVRFAWDQHHSYLDQAGVGFGPVGMIKRAILHYIRNWDVRSSLGVDHFVANSEFVARRIRKTYRRDASVIHPPVDTTSFTPSVKAALQSNDCVPKDDFMGDAAPLAASREDGPVVRGRQSPDSLLPISGSAPNHTGSPGPVSGRGAGGEGQIDPSSHFQFASSNSPHTVPYYITASRLVSQKRIDLVVEAFTQTPGRELIVIGDGPERKRLEAMATPNVRILGHLPEHQMIHWMQHADAFVFAAEEDFGIVPVEAMACGTPVIALGRGGTRETVIDGETGVFFQDQSPESLLHAIQRFESQSWDADLCVRQAQQFTAAQFRDQLRNVCHQQLASSS